MQISKIELLRSMTLNEVAFSYGLENGIKTFSDIEYMVDAIKWDLMNDAQEEYQRMLEEKGEEDDEYENRLF